MRLSRDETLSLIDDLKKLAKGNKPNIFSSSQFKSLAQHKKLPELCQIAYEAGQAIEDKKPTNEFMPILAKLINMYLDYK